MKAAAALLACVACLLPGCARPPRVSTQLVLRRTSAAGGAPAGALELNLKVKNLENRPTTPILVRLSAQTRTGGVWSQAREVLAPAAFVLNRNEQHTLTARLRTEADAVRTVLTLREAENHNLLKTEKSEQDAPTPPR